MEECFHCNTGHIIHTEEGFACDFCQTKFSSDKFNWQVLAGQIVKRYDEWKKDDKLSQSRLFFFPITKLVFDRLKKDLLAKGELREFLPKGLSNRLSITDTPLRIYFDFTN